MILQSVELSPNQKAAIEETLGRKLQDPENIVLCGNKLPPALRIMKTRQKDALPALPARSEPAPHVD
jgi:hypothetical protein